VALEFLSDELAHDPAALQRFSREAGGGFGSKSYEHLHHPRLDFNIEIIRLFAWNDRYRIPVRRREYHFSAPYNLPRCFLDPLRARQVH
jgi:hypothetical protein